ncbi:MAG: 2,3-bisphosphoglycerate-independent phosphoglycerate mutase [Methanosarcinales archaeon]
MGREMVLLTILDGFGLSDEHHGNAILAAHTPNLDRVFSDYPCVRLEAAGDAVGLPPGQMGNSEVGHLNLGAGRVVYQELTRIGRAIEDGSFYQNRALLSAIENVKDRGTCLHLMGLLSDGGVHSHNTHLYALLQLAERNGVSNVCIHAFLDGRDVGPKTADRYLAELEREIDRSVGRIGSISGRYYAMDRDNRWERTNKAFNAIVNGVGLYAESSEEAIRTAYARGESDEFVLPTVIVKDGKPVCVVSEGDSVIFFNFRADRARQITRAFIDSDFSEFERDYVPIVFVSMTEYDESFKIPVAFPPELIANTLGEVVSRNGLKQLRIAETEKYAHVTFFFNGGVETPFSGEDRVLVPSPKVPTYDLKPEMSAPLVTEKVVEAIRSKQYDLIVLNYANCDMVGHTGNFDATVRAVEAVDLSVGRVAGVIRESGGVMILTADHGNAEQMYETSESGERLHTAHTSNPVPFSIISQKMYRLRDGILADVAPTILDLLGLERPVEMTGRSLLIG